MDSHTEVTRLGIRGRQTIITAAGVLLIPASLPQKQRPSIIGQSRQSHASSGRVFADSGVDAGPRVTKHNIIMDFECTIIYAVRGGPVPRIAFETEKNLNRDVFPCRGNNVDDLRSSHRKFVNTVPDNR